MQVHIKFICRTHLACRGACAVKVVVAAVARVRLFPVFSSFDRHSRGSYAIYIWSNPLRRLLRHTSSRPVVNPDSLIIYLTSVSPNTYPPPAHVPSQPLVCISKYGGAGRKVAKKSRPVSGHEIATHNACTQYWVHALCVAILRPESGHHSWST